MKKRAAVVTERCSGCAGTPVCRIFCPQDALRLVDDRDSFPFKRAQVDPAACTGCGSCVARGPRGARILGCPWDAIRLCPCDPPTPPMK
ncbi:MAG: 4Fe-4S dicluster domain-containing protein [bacterium]